VGDCLASNPYVIFRIGPEGGFWFDSGGYPLYLTRATLKGKHWLRLRVGFFTDRIETDTQAKKIMSTLNLTGSWVTKVDKKELDEFGGYRVKPKG